MGGCEWTPLAVALRSTAQEEAQHVRDTLCMDVDVVCFCTRSMHCGACRHPPLSAPAPFSPRAQQENPTQFPPPPYRCRPRRCFYDVLVLKSRGLVDIVQVQEHHARAMAEASTQGMETQAHTQGQAPTQLRGGAAGNADADAAADVLPPRRLAGGEVWVALTQEGIATTARALQQQQQPGAA